jgi:hypothetical protein
MYRYTQQDGIILHESSGDLISMATWRGKDVEDFVEAGGVILPCLVLNPDRSQLIANAKSKIELWASAEKASGFMWDGHQFQSDQASIEALLAIHAGGKGTTLGFWRSTENENIPDGSSAMITALVRAMNARGEEIFARQQAMKASTAAMTDAQLANFTPSWGD